VLKQRVITACLMMLTFLATLFWLPPIAFFAFASAVFLIGAWEWSDLCGFKSVALRSGYVGLSAALGALAYVLTDGASQGEVLRNLLIFSCAWWALALLWVQSFPASALLWRPQPIRAIIGFLVIIPSWLSVTYLLNHPDSALIILLCLLIVAAVDVGAYFSGRRFGRRKLAPNVSPGKSWEGVWGGLVLSILVAFGFISIFSQSMDKQYIARAWWCTGSYRWHAFGGARVCALCTYQSLAALIPANLGFCRPLI